MKTVSILKTFSTLILVAGAMTAKASPLSGTYEVLKNECDQTAFLRTGDKNAVVEATAQGIRVGIIIGLANEDGSIGNRQEFESSFEFAVGIQKVHALGDGYQLFEGTYSADGTQFTDVYKYASNNDSTPVFAGQTVFTLTGDQLQIDNTDVFQPTPGPLKTCLLRKVK